MFLDRALWISSMAEPIARGAPVGGVKVCRPILGEGVFED